MRRDSFVLTDKLGLIRVAVDRQGILRLRGKTGSSWRKSALLDCITREQNSRHLGNMSAKRVPQSTAMPTQTTFSLNPLTSTQSVVWNC